MKRRLPPSKPERGPEAGLKLSRLVLSIALALILLPTGRAEVVKTLNGRVLAVDTRNNLLSVDFQHPATGERKELLFTVGAQTGFSGVKALGQLRPEDPVKIDYEENSSGSLEARHIDKVRIEGPPVGVENFRGF